MMDETSWLLEIDIWLLKMRNSLFVQFLTTFFGGTTVLKTKQQLKKEKSTHSIENYISVSEREEKKAYTINVYIKKKQ